MKKKPIGNNFSSGAEKVERVSEGVLEESRKYEYEEKAAANRVEAAKDRMDAKAAKTQSAEARARARARKKEARAQAFEREISAIEREREAKRKARKNGNGRPDGIGGWIAAVVTLGAATLALTAVVTVGAIDAYNTKGVMMSGYRATMYELITAVEDMDDDLDKACIATSPKLQGELLTEILVKSRLAEMGLEKLPVSFEQDENLMGFLNDTSSMCEEMLAKLASGAQLSTKDMARLEKTCKTMRSARGTLDELAATVEDNDVADFMKGVKNRIGDAFDKLENGSMFDGEGETPPKAMMPGGGDGVMPIPEKKQEKPEGISSGKAEELCRNYFAEYGIQSIEYAGELKSEGMQAYNFCMKDEEGTRLFAQIAKMDGALVRFDYYKECTQHVVDIRSAKALAEVFLEKLGYENMVAVDVEEEGTNAEFTFAYEMDGCICYPDEVEVKVCEERGLVIGLDASDFLKNHRSRDAMNAKVSMEEAQSRLSPKLSVEATRSVLFEKDGKEVLAYEFFCGYNEDYYFVYIDAMSGEEFAICNAKDHSR